MTTKTVTMTAIIQRSGEIAVKCCISKGEAARALVKSHEKLGIPILVFATRFWQGPKPV